MVYGIGKFKEAFKQFADNYVIIGGTACDIMLEGSRMRPRATDDIDMIIIVETMTSEFIDAFWQFVKEGQYHNGKRKRGENKEPAYEMYRFTEPTEGYPLQVELLACHSDLLGEPSGFHIEPLPKEEEQYSLSAIMMDEDFYQLTVRNSEVVDGLRVADAYALVGLKARAYLNLLTERENGRQVNTRDIMKHRNDVLKLAATVNPEIKRTVPHAVMNTMNEYIANIRSVHPSQSLRAALGVNDDEIESLIEILENMYSIES